MNIKHYSQITCYINKLSTVQELTKFVMTGVIIDQRPFRLAFSVYYKGETPLPLVHISPPIEWKPESFCTVDQSALLTLACTFLTGQLKREEYKEGMCGGVSTLHLQEWGKLLQRTPHELGKPTKETLYLMSLLKKQKDLVERLAELTRKLDRREEKLKN